MRWLIWALVFGFPYVMISKNKMPWPQSPINLKYYTALSRKSSFTPPNSSTLGLLPPASLYEIYWWLLYVMLLLFTFFLPYFHLPIFGTKTSFDMLGQILSLRAIPPRSSEKTLSHQPNTVMSSYSAAIRGSYASDVDVEKCQSKYQSPRKQNIGYARWWSLNFTWTSVNHTFSGLNHQKFQYTKPKGQK